VEEPGSLELTRSLERSGVDRTQTPVFTQPGDDSVSFLVVTGNEDVERMIGHRALGQPAPIESNPCKWPPSQ
jgi:hypothetical protein